MSKRGGLGRGLSALIPGAPEAGEAFSRAPRGPRQRDRPQPEAAADPVRRRDARESGGLDPRGRDPAADRRAHDRRGLRSRRGGAAAPRRQGGRAGHRPGRPAGLRRRRPAPRSTHREHPPRGPQPDRAGRGVPPAPRRARAEAGGARRHGSVCRGHTSRTRSGSSRFRWRSSSSSPTTRSPPATRERSSSLGDQEAMSTLALRVAAEDLSVRETEELVRRFVEAPAEPLRRRSAEAGRRQMPRSPRSKRSCRSSSRPGS